MRPIGNAYTEQEFLLSFDRPLAYQDLKLDWWDETLRLWDTYTDETLWATAGRQIREWRKDLGFIDQEYINQVERDKDINRMSLQLRGQAHWSRHLAVGLVTGATDPITLAIGLALVPTGGGSALLGMGNILKSMQRTYKGVVQYRRAKAVGIGAGIGLGESFLIDKGRDYGRSLVGREPISEQEFLMNLALGAGIGGAVFGIWPRMLTGVRAGEYHTPSYMHENAEGIDFTNLTSYIKNADMVLQTDDLSKVNQRVLNQFNNNFSLNEDYVVHQRRFWGIPIKKEGTVGVIKTSSDADKVFPRYKKHLDKFKIRQPGKGFDNKETYHYSTLFSLPVLHYFSRKAGDLYRYLFDIPESTYVGVGPLNDFFLGKQVGTYKGKPVWENLTDFFLNADTIIELDTVLKARYSYSYLVKNLGWNPRRAGLKVAGQKQLSLKDLQTALETLPAVVIDGKGKLILPVRAKGAGRPRHPIGFQISTLVEDGDGRKKVTFTLQPDRPLGAKKGTIRVTEIKVERDNTKDLLDHDLTVERYAFPDIPIEGQNVRQQQSTSGQPPTNFVIAGGSPGAGFGSVGALSNPNVDFPTSFKTILDKLTAEDTDYKNQLNQVQAQYQSMRADPALQTLLNEVEGAKVLDSGKLVATTDPRKPQIRNKYEITRNEFNTKFQITKDIKKLVEDKGRVMNYINDPDLSNYLVYENNGSIKKIKGKFHLSPLVDIDDAEKNADLQAFFKIIQKLWSEDTNPNKTFTAFNRGTIDGIAKEYSGLLTTRRFLKEYLPIRYEKKLKNWTQDDIDNFILDIERNNKVSLERDGVLKAGDIFDNPDNLNNLHKYGVLSAQVELNALDYGYYQSVTSIIDSSKRVDDIEKEFEINTYEAVDTLIAGHDKNLKFSQDSIANTVYAIQHRFYSILDRLKVAEDTPDNPEFSEWVEQTLQLKNMFSKDSVIKQPIPFDEYYNVRQFFHKIYYTNEITDKIDDAFITKYRDDLRNFGAPEDINKLKLGKIAHNVERIMNLEEMQTGSRSRLSPERNVGERKFFRWRLYEGVDINDSLRIVLRKLWHHIDHSRTFGEVDSMAELDVDSVFDYLTHLEEDHVEFIVDLFNNNTEGVRKNLISKYKAEGKLNIDFAQIKGLRKIKDFDEENLFRISPSLKKLLDDLSTILNKDHKFDDFNINYDPKHLRYHYKPGSESQVIQMYGIPEDTGVSPLNEIYHNVTQKGTEIALKNYLGEHYDKAFNILLHLKLNKFGNISDSQRQGLKDMFRLLKSDDLREEPAGKLATYTKNYRLYQLVTRLGGILLAQIADFGTQSTSGRRLGTMNAVKILWKMMKINLTKMTSKEARREFNALMGLSSKTMLYSNLQSRLLHVGNEGIVETWSHILFNITGANWFTESLRSTVSIVRAFQDANLMRHSYEDLATLNPQVRQRLEEFNITASEWNLMRRRHIDKDGNFKEIDEDDTKRYFTQDFIRDEHAISDKTFYNQVVKGTDDDPYQQILKIHQSQKRVISSATDPDAAKKKYNDFLMENLGIKKDAALDFYGMNAQTFEKVVTLALNNQGRLFAAGRKARLNLISKIGKMDYSLSTESVPQPSLRTKYFVESKLPRNETMREFLKLFFQLWSFPIRMTEIMKRNFYSTRGTLDKRLLRALEAVTYSTMFGLVAFTAREFVQGRHTTMEKFLEDPSEYWDDVLLKAFVMGGAGGLAESFFSSINFNPFAQKDVLDIAGPGFGTFSDFISMIPKTFNWDLLTLEEEALRKYGKDMSDLVRYNSPYNNYWPAAASINFLYNLYLDITGLATDRQLNNMRSKSRLLELLTEAK